MAERRRSGPTGALGGEARVAGANVAGPGDAETCTLDDKPGGRIEGRGDWGELSWLKGGSHLPRRAKGREMAPGGSRKPALDALGESIKHVLSPRLRPGYPADSYLLFSRTLTLPQRAGKMPARIIKLR